MFNTKFPITTVMFQALQNAKIPHPWNTNWMYVERVQQATVEVTVAECLRFLREERDYQEAADAIEQAFAAREDWLWEKTKTTKAS